MINISEELIKNYSPEIEINKITFSGKVEDLCKKLHIPRWCRVSIGGVCKHDKIMLFNSDDIKLSKGSITILSPF